MTFYTEQVLRYAEKEWKRHPFPSFTSYGPWGKRGARIFTRFLGILFLLAGALHLIGFINFKLTAV